MINYSDEEADFEAEMARDFDAMTDAEWDQFEAEQRAASEVAMELWAERAMSYGYAG